LKNINTILAVGAVAAVCGAASADTVLAYETAGSAYTQNFNSLAGTGSSVAWSNNVSTPTVTGWNAYHNTSPGLNSTRQSTQTSTSSYLPGTGAGQAGGLYSFGSISSTDRALGMLGSGSYEGAITFAVKNTTGSALTEFTLAWVMEQWRDAGNATAVAQSLVVDYKVTSVTSMSNLAEGLSYLTDAAYTTGFTALRTVSSPVFTSTAGALDGNASANRVSVTDTISGLNWANNTVLVIRFWENNDAGNDHGLAIDDVSFTAVPAPGAAALIGLAGLITTRRRK
jgi:hypothetical protein